MSRKNSVKLYQLILQFKHFFEKIQASLVMSTTQIHSNQGLGPMAII